MVTVSSLLGDALGEAGTDLSEFEDLQPFDIVVLHPGRTLLEKLVLIHGHAQQLSSNASLRPDNRSGRHFYDFFRLLGDDRVRALFADRDQVDQILDDIATITRKHFSKGDDLELRPTGGFASSPAFELASDLSTRLRAAYEETMPELYFRCRPAARLG